MINSLKLKAFRSYARANHSIDRLVVNFSEGESHDV